MIFWAFYLIAVTELIRLIKKTNSDFPPSLSEQISGQVIKDPVHARDISGTRKASLKTTTFQVCCNSRKVCKTLDWKAILGKMLHFILTLFFYWHYFWYKEFFLLQKIYFRPFVLARQQ